MYAIPIHGNCTLRHFRPGLGPTCSWRAWPCTGFHVASSLARIAASSRRPPLRPRYTLPAAAGVRRGQPVPRAAALRARCAAHVSAGNGTLPNDQGQVWREYDISSYTARVTTTKRPEQAIVDWILRETGYEVWHSEPFGILSALPRSLRVYHTPQMQAVVSDIVDRFVASEAETRSFSLRIATIDNPNWRVTAHRTLRPDPRANARCQRLAAIEGRRGRGPGRVPAPQRLPPSQPEFGLPV